MLAAVNGYYDGSNIIMDKNIALKKGQNVIITFESDSSVDTIAPLGYNDDGTPYYRKAGALKGKGWMSADFDEPLEEFKEYMG